MALKKAVQWELVRRNVAESITGPKRERSDIQPLTDDELHAFLNTIKGHEYEALFLVAVTLGLRKGELLGLKWADIGGSVLHIRRTLQRGVELPPKTQSSIRDLRIPASVVPILRNWRKYLLKLRMKAGARWADGDWMFTAHHGTPLDQRNVSRIFDRILKAAKIKHHRFHDLRHTAATHLLRHGARLEDVSKMLGHASKAMTLEVYSHAIGSGSEVASIMDGIIG